MFVRSCEATETVRVHGGKLALESLTGERLEKGEMLELALSGQCPLREEGELGDLLSIGKVPC